MLTLLEMAQHICDIANKTDDATLESAKGFIRRHYKAIWDSALWKESQVVIPAVNYMDERLGNPQQYYWYNIITLPWWIDRVQSMRYGTQAELMEFRDQYVEFHDEPKSHQLYMPPDGSDPMLTAERPTRWTRFAPCSVFWPARGTMEFKSSSALDVGKKIFIHEDPFTTFNDLNAGTYNNGYPYSGFPEWDGMGASLFEGFYEEVVLTGTNMVATQNQHYCWPIITKEKTNGRVTVHDTRHGTFAPSDVLSPEDSGHLYPRIMFWPKPASQVLLMVLCKRRADNLPNDLSTPSLPGSENCIMKFAQADLLDKARQSAKAQMARTEAVALLDQLRDLETNQNAYVARMIPQAESVEEL